MKIYILPLVVMFISIILSGQELAESDKNFNLIYDKIAIQVAGNDPDLAIKKADSLYINSTTQFQKFKSLMLKAHVYAQIGNISSSIEAAKNAETIVNETEFYSWKARISGFISTQYRISGLHNEAKKYLDKTLNHAKKIKSELESSKIQSFVYQESADIAKKENKYAEAVEYYKKSSKILDELPKDNKTNYYLISFNDAYLADAFFLNNIYDSALFHYNKANENLLLSNYDDSKLKSYILLGLGKIDVINKNDDSASAKIKEALRHADEAGALRVKESGNELLTELHLKKGDSTSHNFQTHVQRTIETVKQISNEKQKAADHALQKVYAEKEDLFLHSTVYISLISLMLAALAVIFIRYRRKKKKEFILYQKAINELQASNVIEEYNLVEEMEMPSPQELDELLTGIEQKKELLSKETEEFLMKKLERFERGSKFTDKNMSVSMLSGVLNTNTKYLNYILSKNRNKNFNQYINHLRINYIINKMQTSPEYLQYKISSLAEECGFSSHGKFTEAFKKEIGINPSVFIEFMIKDLKERSLKMEH